MSELSHALLLRRLLKLSWRYRRQCLAVFGYQVALLALGVLGLGLSGLAIDVIRHALEPGAGAPRWPFGVEPPDWSTLGLLGLLGGLVLFAATARGLLNYRYSVAAGELLQMKLVPELRTSVFDKLQRLSFRFFDENASGSIFNRVTGDVQSVRSFVDGVLLQGAISPLGNQYNQALTAMAGAERVFSLLDTQPDWSDAPDAGELPPLEGRVEFRAVSFGYEPGRQVLHQLSFTALPGQTVALVGQTGSGKSSIVNLVAKLYLADAGDILIDGHEIKRVTSLSLHRQIASVTQDNFLFAGSVLENIRLARPAASDEEVEAAARALDISDVIEDLPQGFRTEIGERGAGLSLGQRQVVCFVRAMLADPRILILDEATSSVDTVTESRLQHALAKLLRGRTSFVVAHRLSTIRHADLVLVLDQGRIVESGSHRQLLTLGGPYARMYQQFVSSTDLSVASLGT
jgi:ABC-type multidrug transport system fused ATPase/permease subunit